MVAHIENLAELIENLSKLLGPMTRVVIENHYMGSVAEGRQFDTFIMNILEPILKSL